MTRLTDTSPEALGVLIDCYRRMPPAGDPQALAGALRRLGARYLILPASACGAEVTETAGFRREFRLLYADSGGRAFAVNDLSASEAQAAPTTAGHRSWR